MERLRRRDEIHALLGQGDVFRRRRNMFEIGKAAQLIDQNARHIRVRLHAKGLYPPLDKSRGKLTGARAHVRDCAAARQIIFA